ncbi:MAG TPA: RelA/SpoT domain-containing protein [Candidatus Saccharimonadales bacterium]|nr:RelA/SpoT domain-containing protein [Candidatus Saccharimonadales bacterium]
MSFASRPPYSKGQLDRAGRSLTNLEPRSEAYKEALKVVNDWRTCHAYPLNTFKSTLRLKAGKYDGSFVAQRLKRLPTIVDKLRRFPDMNLAQMQDIGGIRAVVNNIMDVEALQREYKEKGRFTHELVKEKDYISDPKADGYRGVHLVFRYNNTLARNGLAHEYKGLAIELQIRTQLQHTWATAVETVGTLKGESFKTGRGGREWREFFALVSSAFALVEDRPVLGRHADMTSVDIYQAIKDLDLKLKVLESIRGLSAAAQVMHGDGYNGYYSIISLDTVNQRVRIYGFPKNQLDVATKEYAELEAHAGEGMDQVLVSAGDLKSLKVAYPNYFLDVRDFVEKVQVIIDVIS